MRYAFILGRVYTLSFAEIIIVLKRHKVAFSILAASTQAVIIETEAQIDFEKIQRELGGTIKIVKIVEILKKRERDSINFALQNYFKPSTLKKDYFKEYSGKKQFGISVYLLDPNIKAFGEPKRLGMFIKKGLQAGGVSLRAVFPDYNALALNSVKVTKNNLLTKGAEIVVIAGVEKVYVGKSLVVQDFEDYNRRDFQRPARDAKQGMTPPKVAQIMINFADAPKGQIILDPFCGSGTFLQESIILGYKAYGVDINSRAILSSEKNLEWFRNRYKIAPGKYRLETGDATHISELFKGEKIAAVVTEGSLGPIYSELPKMSEIERNFKELAQLWAATLADLKNLLNSGSKVVLCLPAYRQLDGSHIMMPEIDFATALGYTIVDHFPKAVKDIAPFLEITERNSIIYERKDRDQENEQVVAREIITLINN